MGTGFLERLPCEDIRADRNRSVPELTIGGDSPLLLLKIIQKS